MDIRYATCKCWYSDEVCLPEMTIIKNENVR